MLWYSAQYRDWDLSNGTAPREVRPERSTLSALSVRGLQLRWQASGQLQPQPWFSMS